MERPAHTAPAGGGPLITLPASRMVLGAFEAYRVEHVALRFGGDLDVVASAAPYDRHARPVYLGFRRSEGEWRPLAGRSHDLETAVDVARRTVRFAGWDSLELAALLATVGGAR